MKKTLAKILLGLPGLFILVSGMMFLTSPEVGAAKLLLEAQGPEGLSNLRGMAGAPLASIGVMLLLAAWTEKLEYARPAALFLLLLVGARVASHLVDGPSGALALFLAVPTVTFGLMLAGHKLLASGDGQVGHAGDVAR